MLTFFVLRTLDTKERIAQIKLRVNPQVSLTQSMKAAMCKTS
jgi:hypothetical protein